MTNPKVFISYTNIDKKGRKFASSLWRALRKDYDTFFFDHSRKNNTGQNLKSLLAHEVARREIMLVVCTEGLASWSRRRPGEDGGIKWERNCTKFVMKDGRELRIFWSNMYAPLNEFILIDPAATRWTVKPDEETGDRLSAFFVKNANDPVTKVDFYIRTIANAVVLDANRVKAFAFETSAAKDG